MNDRNRDVPFCIEQIDIVNVGAIDFISLNTKSTNHLEVIYAGNGVGKTTLLECMSLLGHIPCFPIYEFGAAGSRPVASPSLLRDITRTTGPFTDFPIDTVERIIDGTPISGDPVVEHLTKERRNGLGFVRLKIRDGNSISYIAIAIFSEEEAKPTLTGKLSRDYAGSHSSDFDLENWFAILKDRNSTDDSFGKLNMAIARGRTFSLKEGVHQSIEQLAKDAGSDPIAVGHACRVTYINTDLNDFGRGNDLRESPKNLRDSLDEQLLRRFRIELDTSWQYKHIQTLNDSLRAILPANQNSYSDAHAVGDGLQITHFGTKDDPTSSTSSASLSLWIKRGSSDPVPAPFLSAGENEVFFILIMCNMLDSARGTTELPRGIILLDEPDLHLANSAKNLFYVEILAKCQHLHVTISSHSYSPVYALRTEGFRPRKHVRTLYRRRVDAEYEELNLIFDPRFMGSIRLSERRPLSARAISARIDDQLATRRTESRVDAELEPRENARHRSREILQALSWSLVRAFPALISRLRDRVATEEGRLSPHLGKATWRATGVRTMAILASVLWPALIVIAAVAVFNDVSDVLFGREWGEIHVKEIHTAVTIGEFVGIALLCGILLARVMTWTETRWARGKLGDPSFAFGMPGRLWKAAFILLWSVVIVLVGFVLTEWPVRDFLHDRAWGPF